MKTGSSTNNNDEEKSRQLERENKELVKQSSIDKKTLITLREVRKALTVSDFCK